MATQSVATISVRPCVMTTPLGTPVVPEVKRMSDGSSGPSAALRRSHLGPGGRRGSGEEVPPRHARGRVRAARGDDDRLECRAARYPVPSSMAT